MNYSLNIKLHENQKKIINHPAKFKVIKAGKRFGKTKLAAYEACKVSADSPNQFVWYLAPTYSMAEMIAWKELESLVPRNHILIKKTLETRLIKRFMNDCELKLLGTENETGLRGPKLRHVVFDEAAYIKEDVWTRIVRNQLLGSKNEIQGSATFISSPNYRGRNWFSRFWDEAKKKEISGDKNWAAFYFTIYDNPTLSKEDIDYIKKETTEETWNTEYMAIESNLAGVLFQEFNSDIHISENFSIENCKLIRALDWGITAPTVCLWIDVDIKNNKVYVENEFVKTGFLINESSKAIKTITGDRVVEYSVIDPSTNKKDPQTGKTDWNEFMRNGIYCIPGDNRNRGYDIVKMFFKNNMLFIHPRCRNLINELKNLQWDDIANNDCTDALRYGIVRIHDTFFGGIFNKKDDAVEERKRSSPNELFFDELGIDIHNEPKEFSWMTEGI